MGCLLFSFSHLTPKYDENHHLFIFSKHLILLRVDPEPIPGIHSGGEGHHTHTHTFTARGNVL